MASIDLFRGGSAVYRPSFCCGDYPAFQMPVDAEHKPGTPPYDSHADGVRGQGWLNLSYPFCPNLLDTTAHRWMHHALKQLKATDDIIRLIWVPYRSYVDSLHIELTHWDKLLDGVKVKPCVERATWDFTDNKWVYAANDAFDQELASFGTNDTINLGTPEDGESPYIFCRFPQTAGNVTWSFSHNILKFDETTKKPTGGIDEFYGANVFGLKITEGSEDAIANIWRANFELWVDMKLVAFECHGFTG